MIERFFESWAHIYKVPRRVLVSLAFLLHLFTLHGAQAEKHATTVEDCVSLHRIIGKPVISRDGTQVAFVVKSPKIATNQNEYQIRLRSLRTAGKPDNGRVLLTSFEEISDLHWTGDAKHLSALLNRNRTFSMPSRIVVLDALAGAVAYETKEADGILEYSVSVDGKTFAYTTPLKQLSDSMSLADASDGAHGLVISDDYPNRLAQSKGAILTGEIAVRVAHRDGQRWVKSVVNPSVMASAPVGRSQGFHFASKISLSPDGRYLAFVYALRNPSSAWRHNRTVKAYQEAYGTEPSGLAVYDLRREVYIAQPELPSPISSTSWSDDGKAYAIMSAAPLGSRWETLDASAGADPKGSGSMHLFAVDVENSEVSEVLPASLTSGGVTVIAWKASNSKMLVQQRTGSSILTLTPTGKAWTQEKSMSNSSSLSLDPVATVDGIHFVGVHEDTLQPPDLWINNPTTQGKGNRLTELNPTVATLALGEVYDLTWKNRFGAVVNGKIVYPPGYNEKQRYPLVIMLTWPDAEFLCDCKYTTAFAPQPLANAGFIVAIFNVYDAVGAGEVQPSGPPQTREAEATVASVAALIDSLDEKGIIQKDDVGIVGFSRSSWKVDYLLTHSHLSIRAASSADGGLGNYGGLWLFDGGEPAHILETSYAASFWGEGRKVWLDGAPALNANRVSAPLLMEYTGNHGIIEQPWTAYEFHSALKLLGKPVELIFYPEGSHPLDTPYDRVGSLQRNVDWFRFWMQGYEGKAPPYDPEQYQRWRRLREQQKPQQTSSTSK